MRYIAIVLVCVLAATARAAAPAASPPAATDSAAEREEAYAYMRLFTEVLLQVRRGYVDASHTQYSNLLYNAMDGMLRSLDPHSQFLRPNQYEAMREDTTGQFAGVGIMIGVREGRLSVIAPIEDTPAERAGVESEDWITEIDGASTEGISIEEAVQRLRGPKGSAVTMRISRAEPPLEWVVELVRDEIRIKSVKDAHILRDGIGYLRITQFSQPTSALLQTALDDLAALGMRALVLDLRGNPGGLLHTAVEVAEKFLAPGALVVRARGPNFDRPAYAGGRTHLQDLPLAVLINRGSASAAEIVAAALQDHRRAVVVGQRSFGKGSVQSVLPLSDGSAMRMTTAHYFTPSERIIHEQGIEPDIEVPLSAEAWQAIRSARREGDASRKPQVLPEDAQLARAVDVLQGVLVFQAYERPRH